MALRKDRIVAVLSRWRPAASPWRLLAWGGRHSLIIYLLHQPLFFGALAGLAAVVPPSRPDTAFTRPCEAQCVESGSSRETCQAACACTAREVRELNLWDRMFTKGLDDAERLIVSRVAQQCLRKPAS